MEKCLNRPRKDFKMHGWALRVVKKDRYWETKAALLCEKRHFPYLLTYKSWSDDEITRHMSVHYLYVTSLNEHRSWHAPKIDPFDIEESARYFAAETHDVILPSYIDEMQEILDDGSRTCGMIRRFREVVLNALVDEFKRRERKKALASEYGNG